MKIENNKINKSSFSLKDFIVQNFEVSRSPEYSDTKDFNLSIDPSGIYSEVERSFQLTLDIKISDEHETFNLELTALGLFDIKSDEEDKNLSNYFYTNAPAIIFPYIRSYVSSVTALSGLETINLPLMNLSKLKDELKSNTLTITE